MTEPNKDLGENDASVSDFFGNLGEAVAGSASRVLHPERLIGWFGRHTGGSATDRPSPHQMPAHASV